MIESILAIRVERLIAKHGISRPLNLYDVKCLKGYDDMDEHGYGYLNEE